MTGKKKFTQVIKKGIVKTILWATVIFILLFATLISLMQIPYVQTKVVEKVAKAVSDNTGFPVTIRYVDIQWFDKILLENLLIADTQNNRMIDIEKMSIDFEIYSLLNAQNINIDEVVLHDAKINLIKSHEDSAINISLFINNVRELLARDRPAKKKKPVFSIDEIRLVDARFSMDNRTRDSVSTGFDYNHFVLDSLQVEASGLMAVADTLQVNVHRLRGYDPASGLDIDSLSTFYRLSRHAMEFNQLNLRVNNSVIRDSVVFNYKSMLGLSYFNDSVDIAANLDSTVIYSKDLARFAPYFNQFAEYYTISGNFDGKVSKFTLKDLYLSFGKTSHLEGNISFDGLPNVQETFIDGNLTTSVLNPGDLKKYISPENYRRIEKFGEVSLFGQFLGFPNDFVANGTFLTDLGKIVSDINLKLGEDGSKSQYSGNLATYNFDLGQLIERPDLVQKIDMNGNINGSGFKLENADFDLKATISRLGFKEYEYRNIQTDARLASEFFNGKLSIDDPNLKFTADAAINLKNNLNKIDIQAKLDTAILQPLNLSQEETFISTVLDVDITGLKLDSINGVAKFKDTYIWHKGRELQIDSLLIDSQRNGEDRELEISSDRLHMLATGNYEYSVVVEDLKKLSHEYRLNFLNNGDNIQAYYKNKTGDESEKYTIDFDLQLNDINYYLNLLIPDVYISQNTLIEGSFSSGYTSIFSLYSSVDTISYKKYNLYNTDLEVNTSKIADENEVLAMAYIFSEKQQVRGIAETNDFLFEGVWQGDHIDFRTNLMVDAPHSYSKIRGNLEFLNDKIEIQFENSDLYVMDNRWEISNDNRISIAKKEVTFNNLKFFNDDQNILINGALSDSVNKKLTVEINGFQVKNFNPLFSYRFSGEINGYLEIRNFYADPVMESEMAIYKLTVGEFLVGNISGLTKWDNIGKELDVDFKIHRRDKKIMNLVGSYNPDRETDQLDITATFDRANINIIEPFVKETFSGIEGLATGEFMISGTPSYPILKGEGIISDGKFKINYLNTRYAFDGLLIFDENEIGVRETVLVDENQNQAELNGGIFHDGFKNFVIDLSAQMKEFQVLNTSSNDNDLYYGAANVTGELNLLGSLSNLKITARATTNKGTKIFIPIGGSSGVDEQEYINFVSFSDSTTSFLRDSLSNKIDLRGLTLDFDLNITPDAYAEIIFDIQSGDIIRGRGNGQINLLIDTQGDFNMFGDFEILNGGYNFTLYNIINKEFDIQSGSKITWYGDPYGGILDINATYRQLASLQPLLIGLDEDIQLPPEFTRRYPAKVLMELEGPLMSPEIDFDIDIDEYPENAVTPNGISLGSMVAAFKSKIETNQQERERQVFSLIILRQFSPENSFSTGGSFGNSVSELLSNQLSYWITQVDENLEIDVDLSGLDAEAFNTFQLRLSYTFFDGRLRVTRSGAFTDVHNETNFQSVFGEWTVEYFLTPDGKFRAKVFNKNNYNAIDRFDENQGFTGGFSLMHITSFDNLKELISDFRKKKKQQQENDRPEPQPKTARTEEEDTKPEL